MTVQRPQHRAATRRQGSVHRLTGLATLATLAVVAAVLLAACVPSPSASDAPTPAESQPLAEGALGMLDCDGQPSTMGGRSEDGAFGGMPADDPDVALRSWLSSEFPLTAPKAGYRELGAIGDRHFYVYENENRVKVVLVFSPQDLPGRATGFLIEEVRACRLAEWGGGVDLGPTTTVWTHEASGEILTDIVGWAHCQHQTARFLHIERADGTLDAQYVRDPSGVVADRGLLDTYANDVDLPEDATYTGYRTAAGDELWFTPANRAAYVVTTDRVERWPRAADAIGCA